MIIGIAGYARSGKDTVANILVENFGYQRVAFADAIRTFAYDCNPIVATVAGETIHLKTLVDRDGWEEAKKTSGVRHFLQSCGVSARTHFGEDFWVRRVLDKISYTGNYVITDVRFKNEANQIKARDYSQLWRVTRPGVGPINNHISEHDLDEYPVDCIFVNDGTVDALELAVKTRMQGILV